MLANDGPRGRSAFNCLKPKHCHRNLRSCFELFIFVINVFLCTFFFVFFLGGVGG